MTGTKLCIYKGGGQSGPAWTSMTQDGGLHLQQTGREFAPAATLGQEEMSFQNKSFSCFQDLRAVVLYFYLLPLKAQSVFSCLASGSGLDSALPAGRHSPFPGIILF